MQQARLIVIADHYLNVKVKDEIISLCLQSDVKERLQNALNIEANLENYKKPVIAQGMLLKGIDSDGNLHFSINEIQVRISKHLVQFRFPFIFRVIADYTALRNAYFLFLDQFLKPFQTKALIAHPSFWEQLPHEIKNEWHAQRLKELQDKIIHESTSFKRTKLNLEHCLGTSASNSKDTMAKKYRTWIYLSYEDLLHKTSQNCF